MTKRFYISDYTGDGLEPETAWYPRILTLQASPAIKIVEGRAIGNTNGPCLVYTDNSDAEHSTVISNPSIIYIPLEDSIGNILNLTNVVGDLDNLKKANIVSYLETKHIPIQGITNNTTLREAMEIIIKRFFLRSNLRGLDLTEGLDTNLIDIPIERRQAIKTKLDSLGFDTATLSGTVREALKMLMNQDIRVMRFTL